MIAMIQITRWCGYKCSLRDYNWSCDHFPYSARPGNPKISLEKTDCFQTCLYVLYLRLYTTSTYYNSQYGEVLNGLMYYPKRCGSFTYSPWLINSIGSVSLHPPEEVQLPTSYSHFPTCNMCTALWMAVRPSWLTQAWIWLSLLFGLTSSVLWYWLWLCSGWRDGRLALLPCRTHWLTQTVALLLTVEVSYDLCSSASRLASQRLVAIRTGSSGISASVLLQVGGVGVSQKGVSPTSFPRSDGSGDLLMWATQGTEEEPGHFVRLKTLALGAWRFSSWQLVSTIAVRVLQHLARRLTWRLLRISTRHCSTEVGSWTCGSQVGTRSLGSLVLLSWLLGSCIVEVKKRVWSADD